MNFIQAALIIIQMGTAPLFPEGEKSLQNPLAKRIEVSCVDEKNNKYVLHTLKKNPLFRKTSPSLFTQANTYGLYFFLTHIDSTYLYIEDCDYSLLRFLRYKTFHQKLEFTVIDSIDNIVNRERLRVIRWHKPVKMFMFEDGNTYETEFYEYTEYWECSEKLDYAPRYPFVKPLPGYLRKNYSEDEEKDLKYILSNPIMVFSVIPLDENNYELPYNLEGRSFRHTMETTSGEDIEGIAIDLNSDKIPDAFWYHDVIGKKVVELFTRLYINVEGKWIPVWYTYFKEF